MKGVSAMTFNRILTTQLELEPCSVCHKQHLHEVEDGYRVWVYDGTLKLCGKCFVYGLMDEFMESE